MTDHDDGPRRPGSRLRAALVCLRICELTDSSAVAVSSRAALPAPLVSSLAARPTRSATSSRTCLKSTCLRSGTTRHPLRHFRGGLVLGCLHQVAVTQDPDQASVLDHQPPADFLSVHGSCCVFVVVVG